MIKNTIIGILLILNFFIIDKAIKSNHDNDFLTEVLEENTEYILELEEYIFLVDDELKKLKAYKEI